MKVNINNYEKECVFSDIAIGDCFQWDNRIWAKFAGSDENNAVSLSDNVVGEFRDNDKIEKVQTLDVFI